MTDITTTLSPAPSNEPSTCCAAFPDWHQDIVELVAEADTVVARFRCTGTHQGPCKTSRGLEDTWTRYQQLQGTRTNPGEHGSIDSGSSA